MQYKCTYDASLRVNVRAGQSSGFFLCVQLNFFEIRDNYTTKLTKKLATFLLLSGICPAKGTKSSSLVRLK